MTPKNRQQHGSRFPWPSCVRADTQAFLVKNASVSACAYIARLTSAVFLMKNTATIKEAPAFVRCYGQRWCALESILKAAGVVQAALTHIKDEIVVREWETVTQEEWVTVKKAVVYSREEAGALADQGWGVRERSFRTANDELIVWFEAALVKPVKKNISILREVFRPYVDDIATSSD